MFFLETLIAASLRANNTFNNRLKTRRQLQLYEIL